METIFERVFGIILIGISVWVYVGMLSDLIKLHFNYTNGSHEIALNISLLLLMITFAVLTLSVGILMLTDNF